MPTWFVPPIVVPAALMALLSACALYTAYVRAGVPRDVVVVEICSARSGASV
jgi:hypothetical protein